jgi:peptidoglycan hydrolase CwlO-like protein
MANVQDPSQLLRIIRRHPALATLLTSSIAGPLFGLWTHNGALVPSYGRLLTQAEAHAPVINTVFQPAPNIPPIDIFGHPHTVSYSAAPRTISDNTASRFTASHYKADISPPPLVSTTARYLDPSSNTGNVVLLTQALIGVVGAAAVVALLAMVFKSWRAKRNPVTDKNLMDFLQVKLMQATNKTADLEAKLESAELNLDLSESQLLNARNEVVKLRSDIDSFDEVTRKHLRRIDRLNQKIEDLTVEKGPVLDAAVCQQLLQEKSMDFREKTAMIARLEQEKMNLNDKIMELNDSIERPAVDLREANHQLNILQMTVKSLNLTCTERAVTLAKLHEEKTELIARLNTQTQAHAMELQALQDKVEDTVGLIEDRGREIRALDSDYLQLMSKMTSYDFREADLVHRLREKDCALQQANSAIDYQSCLRIFEHGLGV